MRFAGPWATLTLQCFSIGQVHQPIIIHGVDCVSAELDDETAPEKSDELAARMKERVSPNSIAFSCVAWLPLFRCEAS